MGGLFSSCDTKTAEELRRQLDSCTRGLTDCRTLGEQSLQECSTARTQLTDWLHPRYDPFVLGRVFLRNMQPFLGALPTGLGLRGTGLSQDALWIIPADAWSAGGLSLPLCLGAEGAGPQVHVGIEIVSSVAAAATSDAVVAVLLRAQVADDAGVLQPIGLVGLDTADPAGSGRLVVQRGLYSPPADNPRRFQWTVALHINLASVLLSVWSLSPSSLASTVGYPRLAVGPAMLPRSTDGVDRLVLGDVADPSMAYAPPPGCGPPKPIKKKGERRKPAPRGRRLGCSLKTLRQSVAARRAIPQKSTKRRRGDPAWKGGLLLLLRSRTPSTTPRGWSRCIAGCWRAGAGPGRHACGTRGRRCVPPERGARTP